MTPKQGFSLVRLESGTTGPSPLINAGESSTRNMQDTHAKWLFERRRTITAFGLVTTVGLWLVVAPHIFALLESLLLVLVLGSGLSSRHRESDQRNLSLLEVPFALACDVDLFARYQRIAESLTRIRQSVDPIFRELALESLDETVHQVHTLANGELLFEGTETWRLVYERLLRSRDLHRYRSVAWIQSPSYWQDEPGRKSMAVNFELQNSGQLTIERIAIIADELWPETEVWPVETLRQWIHEQYARGIQISYVRQSAIAAEPDLLADIGIYGSRAVGTQELDEHARTTRFRLVFDFNFVTAAEDRWNRLSVYSETFASYLDRYEMDR